MRFSCCLLLLFLLGTNTAEAAKVRIVVTSPAGLQQPVYLARPLGLEPDRPVLFALHDDDRDASSLCDALYPLAEEYRVLIVVPEFSERLFPGPAGYAEGNVRNARGRSQPSSDWAFSSIEPIFDAVKARFAMTADGYSLYGYAAGAEFAQRFLYFVPDARLRRAGAADPQDYTLPEFTADYPLGLGGSAVGERQLRQALTLPFTLFLGEADVEPGQFDPGPGSGENDPAADRLARGRAFYARARLAAEALQVPFSWQLVTVPVAGSEGGQMIKAAIRYLLP